ncbi:MAG: hypothetical protein WC069_06405 [Candidatus Shapirobacteria bacterium]|nr:hypothetical protein [Terrimicrobiaceae bacterium]
MRAIQFLKQLATNGGAIVSSNSCSEMEIADAKATDRFFVDEEGFGFVWRSEDWLAINKNRELVHPNTDGKYSPK